MSTYFQLDTKYLIDNTFWLTTGNFLQIFISALSGIILANLLDPTQFGIYKYIFAVAGMLGAFLLTGTETSLTQATAAGHHGAIYSEMKTYLRWSLFYTSLCFAVAAYYFLNENTVLASSLIVLGLFVPLMNAFEFYNSFLKGTQRFKEAVTLGIIRTLIPTIATIASAFITQSILIVIVAYYISNLLVTGLLYLYIVSKYSPPKEDYIDSGSYGKHLSLMNAFPLFGLQIDKILVFQHINAQALAGYSIAIMPVEYIRSFTRQVKTLLLPRFSNRSFRDIKKNIWRKVVLLFIVCLSMAIFYILLAPIFIEIVFPKYTDITHYSQLYAVTLLFIPNIVFTQALVAKRCKRQLYVLSTLSTVLRILFMIAGVFLYGIIGVIFAEILTRAIHFASALISFYHAVRQEEKRGLEST